MISPDLKRFRGTLYTTDELEIARQKIDKLISDGQKESTFASFPGVRIVAEAGSVTALEPEV